MSLSFSFRSERDLRKYDALPPIKTADRKSNKVTIEEKPSPNYQDKPVPPRPVLHHLAVTVTTHALSEYNEILPNCVGKCFIQR